MFGDPAPLAAPRSRVIAWRSVSVFRRETALVHGRELLADSKEVTSRGQGCAHLGSGWASFALQSSLTPFWDAGSVADWASATGTNRTLWLLDVKAVVPTGISACPRLAATRNDSAFPRLCSITFATRCEPAPALTSVRWISS
jgi:hypothetical protein